MIENAACTEQIAGAVPAEPASTVASPLPISLRKGGAVSIIPGRMRLTSSVFTARPGSCRVFEDEMKRSKGVREVSASHRTGRALVVFDERLVGAEALVARAEEVLSRAAAAPEKTSTAAGSPKTDLFSAGVLLDVAMHLLIPAPLDFLIPAAAAAFRR